MKLSESDGIILLKLARETLYAEFNGKKLRLDESLKERYCEKNGAFVTIHLNGRLRGCIGYIERIFPLWECISKAAEAAAFSDSRFAPLTKQEFDKIDIEISVLTSPEEIICAKGEIPRHIHIGQDGLIVEKCHSRGLLLPQVFIEYESSPKGAIEMTCMKAGLPKDAWKEKNCRIWKFSAMVFNEREKKQPKSER